MLPSDNENECGPSRHNIRICLRMERFSIRLVSADVGGFVDDNDEEDEKDEEELVSSLSLLSIL